MKRALILFLVTCLSLVLACSRQEDVSTARLYPVTLRLQWLLQTQFAGYYVAREKGYYREVGLDVRFKEGGYGKNSLASVSEGIEEFGIRWIFDLMPQLDKVIILANILKDTGLFFVAKKGSGISSVRDFAGRKVSIWFTGNEYQLYLMLDRVGLRKEDVSIVAQHFDLNQFIKGEVDVTSAMSYNELLQLEKLGYDAKRRSLIDPASVAPVFPGDSIFTSREFFKKEPEICKRFVAASIRGWEYAIRYPEEATRIVLKYDIEGRLKKDEQLVQLSRVIKLIKADRWPIGSIDLVSLSNVAYYARRYGFIKKDVPLQSLFNNTAQTGRQ